MTLKAVHVLDVPHLDYVTENNNLFSSNFSSTTTGVETDSGRNGSFGNWMKGGGFLVIGHRGNGMNKLQSSDKRMTAVKENTILSFNTAARYGVDFIEFDVQVTKDGCPIIFHDNFIISQENGTTFEKRVTELTLSEFLVYGPQSDSAEAGKPLLRKNKGGEIIDWKVEADDKHCTLQEALESIEPKIGFNIELKFDDHIVYDHDYFINVLQSTLQVVYEFAKDRPIIFSTFQPDAALLVRKLQGAYPVFFLTTAGCALYDDVRRNSLEEALKLCLGGGLHGIVSEVKGIFRNPGAVSKIKESNLSLLTYGQLNNVREAVYLQRFMGIDGVIVDSVQEIMEDVNKLIKPAANVAEETASEKSQMRSDTKPQFSERELSFLLKLIPELIAEQ